MTRKVDYITAADVDNMNHDQRVALAQACYRADACSDELVDADVYVVETHYNHIIIKASELWTASAVAARFGLTVEHIAADIHRVVVAL